MFWVDKYVNVWVLDIIGVILAIVSSTIGKFICRITIISIKPVVVKIMPSIVLSSMLLYLVPKLLGHVYLPYLDLPFHHHVFHIIEQVMFIDDNIGF